MSSMFKIVLLALAFMLILEGMMPLAAPDRWRKTMLKISELADGQLRFLGLCSMLAGLVLLLVFL